MASSGSRGQGRGGGRGGGGAPQQVQQVQQQPTSPWTRFEGPSDDMIRNETYTNEDKLERAAFQLIDDVSSEDLARIVLKSSLRFPSDPPTQLRVYQSGSDLEFREVLTAESDHLPTNSTSLLRRPSALSDFHTGSTTHFPFLPGGLDLPSESSVSRSAGSARVLEEDLDLFRFETDPDMLLTVPPTFFDGVSFHKMPNLDVPELSVTAAPTEEPEELKIDQKPAGETLITEESYQPPSLLSTIASPSAGVASAIKSRVTARDIFLGDDADIFGEEEEEAEEEEEEEEEEEAAEEAEGEGESPTTQDSTATAQSSEDTKKAIDLAPTERNKAAIEEAKAREEASQWDDVIDNEDDWIAAITRKEAERKAKEQVWAVMERMKAPLDLSQHIPEMAKAYPFELDQFQKEAIYHLERNECVFVAAHTSAGKTVVAEYAIALAAKHLTRAIYTSPIKALSNQKFRDFKETFGDVGLITGDVSLHPEASCLIVTTEVLRSMLYKGADLIRDVEWVIFDEVHYINDLERGVVWEEVIIMLPAHVNLILLSATVPNTFEFADWVGRTKKKPVYVISTDKRPTPLEHYIYTTGKMFKIVDSKRTPLEDGYRGASLALKEIHSKPPPSKPGQAGRGGGGRGGGGGSGGSSGGAKKPQGDRSHWLKMIEVLRKQSLLPVVVFAFSKRKCEEYGHGLTTTDLTTSSEKSEIHSFIERSTARLTGTDKELPQVLRMKDLLKRGVGVHHGGLLPIIKEMVEILFSRGLIKVLFATETFAMGVNMPARTVVFSSLQKHDGQSFRELLPGEYTQMSGRAGRRGLDAVGTVIISCPNELPDRGILFGILLGQATKLESQFRLTYNMILNLLRVEDFQVEDMIKRSFSESHTQRKLPQQLALLKRAEERLRELEKEDVECIFGEPDIENYHSSASKVNRLNETLNHFLLSSRTAAQSLVPGRVVVISSILYPNSLVVLLRVTDSKPGTAAGSTGVVNKTFQGIALLPAVDPETKEWQRIIEFQLRDITAICKTKLNIDIQAIVEQNSQVEIAKATQELVRLQETSGPEGPPTLHPIRDLKINDFEFIDRFKEKEMLQNKMRQSKCHRCPKLPHQYEMTDKKMRLKEKVLALRHYISDENLQLMPDFQQRIMVLQTLNYVSEEDRSVLIKGRVARELNTVRDELIATEIIFENVLTDLAPEECVALLSSLIFQESSENEPQLTPTLTKAKEAVINLATNLANLQADCQLPVNVKDYLRQLNWGLVEVVYEWAKGLPFAEICELTDVQEGSVVRCITRLDETCREVRNAARIIGDASLFQKMEEASKLIKRDIVFASSLYIA